MVSALAIDGAAMAIAPRAAITCPNFFMSSSSVERGINIGAWRTFPGNPKENSERSFRMAGTPIFTDLLETREEDAQVQHPVAGHLGEYDFALIPDVAEIAPVHDPAIPFNLIVEHRALV